MTPVEMLKQVENNKLHERHRTYQETVYWCNQWRLLAEQLAAEIDRRLIPARKKR